MAIITAHNSLIYFDCAFPRTFRAVFLLSFWPNQMPLLQLAFSLPLLKHAPSVYMVIGGSPISCGWVWCRVAGEFEILPGSVKILKHSMRFVLLVMVRLKVMSWFVLCAVLLLVFLVAVSERLSHGGGPASGFSFGAISCSLMDASVAQAWGFRQSFCLSSSQSRHWQ